MRITVDRDVCGLHGQCVIAAPDVFSFDDAGNLVVIEEPDEAARDEVMDAIDVCPTQALSVEG